MPSLYGLLGSILNRPKGNRPTSLEAAVARGLSGYGGLARHIVPIKSRVAAQSVSTHTRWFVPVITTEANPRLLTITSPGQGRTDVIVWDERLSHYVNLLILGHQVCSRTPIDGETTVHIFTQIGTLFVLEQLCPRNRLPRAAPDRSKSKALLNHVYRHYRETSEATGDIAKSLLESEAMKNPGDHALTMRMMLTCRELSLDHEASHYLRAQRTAGNRLAERTAEMLDEQIERDLDLFASASVYGNRPPGRVWRHFDETFRQAPYSLIRERITGTPLHEEVVSDLTALLLYFDDIKEISRDDDSAELDEFKALAEAYSTGRIWQISTVFLQGLKQEVSRILGLPQEIPKFWESDLGIRLMLGNFLSYSSLIAPPYGEKWREPKGDEVGFSRHIQNARTSAMAIARSRDRDSEAFKRIHRQRFLDTYELSSQSWVHVLNQAALQICDMLEAQDLESAPTPRVKDYLAALHMYLDKPN